MSILRMNSKLPSGEDGFYIYHNVDGRLYVYTKSEGVKMTKSDLDFLIEKLQYARKRYWDDELL